MKTLKKDTTPIVLFSNQNAINDLRNKLDEFLPIASTLVTEYFNLEFANPDADLYYIATQSVEDERKHLLSLIPDELTLNGLKINKASAIKNKLFELPEHREFDEALSAYQVSELPSYERFFVIKDKEVSVNPDEWQLFNDQKSIIASSPDEIAMVEVWQEAITALETLDLFMRSRCNHPVVLPGPAIALQTIANYSDGGLKINYKAFELFKKNLKKFNA